MTGTNFWSQFKEFSGHLRDLSEADGEFLWFLTDASALQRQRTFLWLANKSERNSGWKPDREDAHWLRTSRTAEILKAIAPDLTGADAVLRKMGPLPWPAKNYRALVAHLRNAEARLSLAHMKKVRPGHLMALDTFGPNCFEPNTLSGMKHPDQMRQAAGALAALECLADRHADLRIALVRDGHWDRLSHTRLKAELRKIRIDPPFTYDDLQLRFLGKWPHFRAAGRQFHNCIGSDDQFWRQSLCGTHAYFQWLGPFPALIETRNDPLVGWHVHDISGPHNAQFEDEELPPVIDAFAEYGIPFYPGLPSEDLFLDESYEMRRAIRRF